MKITERRRRLTALCLAALLGMLAVVMVEANAEASGLEAGYQASARQLHSQMSDAAAQGYTSDDLAPVSSRLALIQAVPEPIWVGERPAYYREQGQAISSLGADLLKLEVAIAEDSKGKVALSLSNVGVKISQDRQLEVDSSDLQPVQARFDLLSKASTAATKITDYRSLAVEAAKLDDQAAQLGQAQIAENTAISQGADDLKAKSGGSADAVRKGALKALADARDDATVEGFLAMRNNFTAPESITRPLNRLEKYAAKLDGGDLNSVALAASGVARYAGQVHDVATKGMPAKTIVIYLQDQYLRAYDHGQDAMGTVVTTGRPSLPTDVGPMKILYRQSPFIMKSPWPKESPYWYPDSPVRKVMWFTETGEGLHDAPWRGDYGAGTNIYDGTHGCVNLPGDRVDWVWNWAPDGTPVIVIPGTGQTQAAQLAQNSIDTPAGSVIKGA